MSIEIYRGDMPLVVAFPHTGTDLPTDIEPTLVSPWQARRDADWWIDELYDFTADLGATTVRTSISRTVIDVNRDPSGASLYPGQATTELCPTTDFDGAPLYRGEAPGADEIARRRALYFDPYHTALAAEIARLRKTHDRVVVYDAHSIRSHIPRLFDGALPQFNIGTNDGATCDPVLAGAVTALCERSGQSYVLDGRFKGGWTTRHYGRPAAGVHAIQMELAMRGYMAEPAVPTPDNWPSPIDRDPVVRPILTDILKTAIAFARGQA